MTHLAQITGWNKKWPAIPKRNTPRLLAFLDAPFLNAASPNEVNLALNALAVAGFGLMQHIRKNHGSTAVRGRLKLPEIRLLMTSQPDLPARPQV